MFLHHSGHTHRNKRTFFVDENQAPQRSVEFLEVGAVKKKFKDKSFARQVNRDDISQGAAEMGVEMDAHIGLVIAAMRGIAPELGLQGTGE